MAPPVQEAAGRDFLPFLTCGSVDDGKSTLIGRLLFETRTVFDDQLVALTRDSRKHGTTGQEPDFALLLDGLEAEREQGITIDVAYRFFSTPRRAFMVADTPGHEQYTRNMATGASNADAAVLLVDARKGLLEQTRRHSYICSLFGIRDVALAINKIDLVGYSRDVYGSIASEYAKFAAPLDFTNIVPIPVSARFGENIASRSVYTPWYEGPTLLAYLESVRRPEGARPFRFPVQWVNRTNPDSRGFAGTVASGALKLGDEIAVASSGQRSRVDRIFDGKGNLDEAAAGSAVTIHLSEAIDVSRGDLLAHADDQPLLSDQFAAHLLWMGDEPLLPGRSYLMRTGTAWTPATITAIKHRVDVHTLKHLAARQLVMNEIGFCTVGTARRVAFDRYAENRATGGFILVDRMTNQTAAAGIIDFSLHRAANTGWERLLVDRSARAAMKRQRPAVVWLTGLSGSGKSTIAKELERRLHLLGCHTYVLDGDNLRHGLNRDLGFTAADRVENIRRAGEVARLMTEAGLIVICSFISPFRAERRAVRDLFADDEFIEVFVDAPLAVCMERDPKGLYAKVKAGLLPNFTGVDSPYEAPERPELALRTDKDDVASEVDALISLLRQRGSIP